jgi:hypothetical protein
MSTLLAFGAAVVALLGAVLVGVARDLVSDELKACLQSLARRLVHRSASRVPAELRDRYDQEWGAEVEHILERERTLGALKFALDLWLHGARGVANVAPSQRFDEPAHDTAAPVEPQTPFTPVITLHPELTHRASQVPRDLRRIDRDLALVRQEPPPIEREAPPIQRDAGRSGWKWS